MNPSQHVIFSKRRVIVFDVGQLLFTNLYLKSRTDGQARDGREKICSEILPNLLFNSKESGCSGGDFNCITKKNDATKNPESKMSRCLERLIKLKEWKNSYRSLHPKAETFSRYYANTRAEGASRIDRCYHYGSLKVKDAKYVPLAFSDHFGHIVQYVLPEPMSQLLSPKSRPTFKLRAEVLKDALFKEMLTEAMVSWQRVRKFNDGSSNQLGILNWWEMLVKPGIRKLAQQRSKEINIARREELNLLLLRQSYLTWKVATLGQTGKLGELKAVHLLIENWYNKECQKVQHQSRVDEFQSNEKSSIYHHELHKRIVKKSSILKLDTGVGVISGHGECAAFLEQLVEDLLLNPAQLDPDAQQTLLAEVDRVFTEEDIKMFLTPPSKQDVWETICSSNLNAAPGSDGIPSLAYKECWPVLGDPLTEVMLAIHNREQLPLSMRISLMVFGAKPKKTNSILPKDKRRISLLNSDFKCATGLEARCLKKLATHTLSPLQLAAGDDRHIHHGINSARNAIYAAGKPGHPGCGILDTDLIAAFDWLCLDWGYKVLEKKGLTMDVIMRLQNLYRDNLAVVVVNNVQGRCIKNVRLSLKQGDLPSMHLFSYGIDPLLHYLEKRLKGIFISSLPLHGPVLPGAPPLVIEERYKVIGYADDVKPAVTSYEEFILIDKAMALFESASGCKLHRDPATKKCKFLPLAKWKGTMVQKDIPCEYMSLSDHLDMVGVELRATWVQTRKANGDTVQGRVSSTTKQWKTGKFMHLSMRSWSVNQYCLSKVWFKTHSVDLRAMDVNSITSSVKSWLYADQLVKPEEMVMFRPPSHGGLGLHNVKLKAMAGLIRTFLETACNPKFQSSLYHSMLYRYHVLEDRSFPNPGYPPFYNNDFFNTIRSVNMNSSVDIGNMSEKEWYTVLLEDQCTMEQVGGDAKYIPCNVEKKSPHRSWDECWRKARLPGLGPENVSFLFKLMHNSLVTQERLSRTSPNIRPTCKFPGCPGTDTEDRCHALYHCPGNNDVGKCIFRSISNFVPGLEIEDAITLDFHVDDPLELPVVWALAVAWSSLWDLRQKQTRPQLYMVRAQMEAKIALLRECRRFSIILETIDTIIENL